MQQSKAEDRYSCETLLSMNTLYDHEHHLTQADVDAADAAGCHPHEGNVWAQADRARSIFTDSLDQGVAVEVTVARG